MFKVKALAFAALTIGLLWVTPVAQAQVAIGVNIGPAPVCPYGYFDYAPYDCAPYGYYGPDWAAAAEMCGLRVTPLANDSLLLRSTAVHFST